MGMFWMGAGVTITHGIYSALHPHEAFATTWHTVCSFPCRLAWLRSLLGARFMCSLSLWLVFGVQWAVLAFSFVVDSWVLHGTRLPSSLQRCQVQLTQWCCVAIGQARCRSFGAANPVSVRCHYFVLGCEPGVIAWTLIDRRSFVRAADRSLLEHIRSIKDPMMMAVVLEDVAATTVRHTCLDLLSQRLTFACLMISSVCCVRRAL